MTRSARSSARRPPILAVATVALLSTLLGLAAQRHPEPASADHSSFAAYWTSSPAIRRGHQSGLGLSNAAFEVAADRAGNTWDDVPNNIGADSPDIGWAGTSNTTVTDCYSANEGEILAGSGDLAAPTIGRTSYCWTGATRLVRASVRISTNVAWADGAESGKFDIQSVLTHELGHAMGWRDHLSSPCSGSERATMCPSTSSNSAVQRTLEPVELEIFDTAYD